jgi:acyl-coenzyme A synthetase/AMP-(fatty) acid ligase
MKRAVICTGNPEHWIPQLPDHSIMIVNPASTPARKQYLMDSADWSLLIDEQGEHWRDGGSYSNEKVLWYTSGTTGDSKFCSFSRAQVDLLAEKICNAYELSANDRYVSIMGLWHAHGQGFYWAAQRAQCETNYLSIKNIKSMSAFDPTFITAIPDVLKVAGQFDFDHLRFIRSASAPLSPALYSALVEKFDVPVVEAFGMTEALSHCFTNPLHGEQRVGTVGLPDGIDAKIEQGHLLIKGATVSTDGWYDTGDLADQDDAGYYRILGRSRDQINVRGIKLNPVSLENQLLANVSGLAECVIFGEHDVRCLYVGTCDSGAISNFLSGLGNHCRPKFVQAVDAIPVAPSGKVSRSYLSTQF